MSVSRGYLYYQKYHIGTTVVVYRFAITSIREGASRRSIFEIT